MKKKTLFIIIAAIIAVIIIIFGAMNISVYMEFKKVISTQFEPGECEIAIKSYSLGQDIDVDDIAIREEILRYISELEYGGVSSTSDSISPDDHAYSIILTSKQAHEILTVAENPDKSEITGGDYNIAIKNYEGLYETVKSLFE